MKKDIYLSTVVAGRNDNYGGDFNERLQNSINSFTKYAERFALPSEFIIVNYNPLLDQPSLSEVLHWPTGRNYVKFRIITVPGEIHQHFNNPEVRDSVPLFEYIAKNIGIRRAQGQYINAGNPDILYPPELISLISGQCLSPNKFYRTDRVDFHKVPFDPQNLPDDFIAQIQKNAFRVFLIGHNYFIDFSGYKDFIKRLNWLRSKNQQRIKEDVYNRERKPEFNYHCHCSGDFMMLHRDAWWNLKANPENTRIAAHTDSRFVIMAAAAGLKEHVFAAPIYHQDHGRRYNCEDGQEIPAVRTAYLNFVKEGMEMLHTNNPNISNGDTWGIPDIALPDEIF